MHQHPRTGEWTLTEPKTPRSRRQIALAGLAVVALEHHRARLEELVRLMGSGMADPQLSRGVDERRRDLVFSDANGEPRTPQSAHYQLGCTLPFAGMPRIRVHDRATQARRCC